MSSSSPMGGPEVLVSQAQLAWIFDVSTRTIQRWESEGLDRARVGVKATYDLRKAVQWLLERERGDDRMSPLDRQRMLKIMADRRRVEFENAVREGELITVEIHERRCGDFAAAVNGKLRSAVSTWATALEGCETIPERQARLKALVNGLLKELAENGDGDRGAAA